VATENDALSQFDFSKVMKAGKFLKFEAGKSVTLRVLTVDPVVSQVEYTDKKTGDVTLNTKFAFVVYNFTDEKAQILQATPGMAKRIGDLHNDPDFGGNIRNIDIKITPTGEMLERRYEIQVLPKARPMTNERITECAAIKLDDEIENGQRMSFYDPGKATSATAKSGVDDEYVPPTDTEIEEPINLSDIPF